VVATALSVVLCATRPSALAQSNDYKALTDAAVEEHSLGHYEEARALFARAHAIAPSARTFWGMGIAAFEARHYVDAIQLLEQARDDSRKPLTPAQRKQTDSLLERSLAFVVRVPIRVDPASAKVSIDGRDMEPDASGTVLLDAGTHQVVITAKGYEDVVRSMRWEAGNAEPFEVQLEKREPAHGGEAAAGAAAVAAPVAGSAPQAEGTRSFTVLKWVSLGATAASLGIMGAGLALRQSAAVDYNDQLMCAQHEQDAVCVDKRNEENKWKAMAIAGGAAAGVFGVLSVVFFVLDRRPDSKSARTQCGPAFEAGALCQLRF
jgi:tetratricopeptide (TPR) repeat protein